MVNRDNVIAGAEQQGDDDKDYELSTLEKQMAFAKKRNYHISNTDNPIDFPVETTGDNKE
jgi:hypothetical protein